MSKVKFIIAAALAGSLMFAMNANANSTQTQHPPVVENDEQCDEACHKRRKESVRHRREEERKERKERRKSKHREHEHNEHENHEHHEEGGNHY